MIEIEDEESRVTSSFNSHDDVDEEVGDDNDSTYESPLDMKLGDYSCKFVTNIPLDSNNNDPSSPRTYFDLGLRHFFAYHHEEAYKCFLACLTLAPDCAFAHGMVALCHCPNYNFKGDAYDSYIIYTYIFILVQYSTKHNLYSYSYLPVQKVMHITSQLIIQRKKKLSWLRLVQMEKILQ